MTDDASDIANFLKKLQLKMEAHLSMQDGVTLISMVLHNTATLWKLLV